MKKSEGTWEFLVRNTKQMFKDITSGDKEKFKRQFANLLTMSRGILAPLLIVISVTIHSLTMSFIVILVSALTDCFDGWYARHYNYVSEYGALLDTICDKIFILCVILPVLSTNYIVFAIILFLELLISIINCYFNMKGKKTISRISGKIKTIILDTSLVLCYLNFLFNIPSIIINIFLIITIISQVIASINYVVVLSKK